MRYERSIDQAPAEPNQRGTPRAPTRSTPIRRSCARWACRGSPGCSSVRRPSTECGWRCRLFSRWSPWASSRRSCPA